MVTLTDPSFTLDCSELGTRALNETLRGLPDGSAVTITNPWGAHNLAVALRRTVSVTVAGNAGYFLGGLGDGPNIDVEGFVGWGAGENLMSGSIRVRGSASQSLGASAHGGTIVVEGDASLRAGISLKGGTICVAGDVGAMTGFMAQAGTVLVGGDAGHGLGDSIYEAIIYVAGSIASLGADARIEELGDDDVVDVKDLCVRAGFDHIEAEGVKKVTSARRLYHFSSSRHQEY